MAKRVNTAERLKTIMEERNLKQIDILKLCIPYCELYDVKMNKSDLSQYVSGKVEPSQDKLVILGMALNVNETWLMGYNVPPEKHFFSDNKSLLNNELIEKYYGKSTKDALDLYIQLDPDDQGEIRGEMKQMLKAKKYSVKKSRHA